MLFNSHVFIFAFLPAALALFWLGRRYLRVQYANGVLVLCSLFFYGYWIPGYVPLIAGSIIGNYVLASQMASREGRSRKALMWLGIAANLGVLGYFKYTGFLIENLSAATGWQFPVPGIVLPIGISFYTFQQIAFLVGVAAHRDKVGTFVDYCLFVSFFPQLIAGPIVHHREMMPQFAERRRTGRYRLLFMVGTTLFVIGLSKKVLIADTVALFATPVFDATLAGKPVSFFEAWGGVLAYTFQIYFDFSGYSDMAAGLALMFGIRLPMNFYSPYKATSVIDFWRRWHITLSRFLLNCVYIPLGGNRHGEPRRLTNVFITMFLGGIWHGAAWTFVIWGALHGLYICLNHLWRKLPFVVRHGSPSRARLVVSCAVTFLFVVLAWTFFRAESLDSAQRMLSSMFGANGIGLPEPVAGFVGAGDAICAVLQPCTGAFPNGLAPWRYGVPLLALLLAVAWFVPNSYEILRRYRPMLFIANARSAASKDARFASWRPTIWWGILVGSLFAACTVVMTGESEFLYFQF